MNTLRQTFLVLFLASILGCTKSRADNPLLSMADIPEFANNVELSSEFEISIEQFKKEIDVHKSAMMSVHEGLSFTNIGVEDRGYINAQTWDFFSCPEKYHSNYVVVKKDSPDIYFLYEESKRKQMTDDPRCSYFTPDKKHLEMKKLSTTNWFIFNLPTEPIALPNFIKIFKGKKDDQLRYRVVGRGENTSYIGGQAVVEIHKIQAIINPYTMVARSIEYFERIVALKSDPSKFTRSFFNNTIADDKNPDDFDWRDLPVDDDTL